MKKLLLLSILLFSSMFAQTSVFSDNFNTSQGATYSTTGNIGTSSWNITRSGADFGARIDPAILDLTNDAGATANVAGWVYVNQPYSNIASPFNATLSSNAGLVTWTFNMRQIRTDPAGFTSGSYGVAVILGTTSQTPQASGTGYAVVLGQSGSTDPVRLVKFSAGLQTLTNILTSNTAGLTDFGAEYLSVKVTFTPSTNTWELFLRSDGSSAFTDPTTGTLVSQGTAVDNSYTGTALSYFGAYWQGSTAGSQTAFFDNVKVTVDVPTPPSAPTANAASNILQTSFTANWSSVSGAETYLLDVSKVNDFSTFVSGYNGKDVDNVTSSSVTGLGADSTYYYRVRASNTSGASTNSNTITVNTLPNAPSTPTANDASNVTQTGLTANWGSVAGATKYFLDLSTASDFTLFVPGYENKDVGNVTTYDLTGLTSGTTYYYRVRAFNTGGTSANSNTINKKLIPANPAITAATNKTQTSFTANWNSVTGASLYLVDVSTSRNFESFVTGYNNKDVGMNSVSVTGLTAATEYFYRVRAQNQSGTSGNSGVDSTETLPNPPATPTASAGTAISSSSFTANWSEVPEATTNFITVGADTNFTTKVVDNLDVGDVTSYTVNGLTPATDYYYVIKTGNAGGTSGNSNRIKVTTNPGVPGTPTATTATNITNNSFRANWNAVGGASKYLLTVSPDSDFVSPLAGFNDLDVGNNTSYNVTGLNPSTDYYYRVKSSNVSGQSGNSNRIKATTNPHAPGVPVATSATTFTTTGFTANWNSSSNASKYFLDVSTQNDFSNPVTGYDSTDVGNVTTLNITGLTAGTTYYYRVYASNVTGTSSASNTITTITVPAAPTAAAASNTVQTGFTANWNSVTGAAKYFLDVSTSNDFSSFVTGYENADMNNVLTVNVTGLAANTVYHYRVRANNSSGSSINSNVINVTTLPNAPTAPVASNASSITANSFNANWAASGGAAKYFLDVSTQNNFSSFVTGYQNKDVGNVITSAVTGLNSATQYYYRVRAFNTGGTSDNSNVVNLTTSSSATQTLTAGDIAIIGINGDDPDQFSFIPLVDLQAGTVVRFTDSGIKADGTFRGGEGAVKYTTPSGGITAGTVITFTSPASGNFANDNDATVGTSGVALSTSGDQITAFQGSSNSPTFLYSVTTNRNTFDSEAGSSNQTALPTGLTNGTNAVAVGGASADNDDAVYNMSLTTGTRNELLSAISNNANWNVSSTHLAMPTGSFTVGSGGATIPSAPAAQNASNITASGFTANWNSSSGATKYYLDVATDALFSNKLANYNNKDVGNSISSSVTGLSSSTSYFYQLRANNSAGTSANSNTIAASTLSNLTFVQFSTAAGSVNESAGTFNLVFTITNPDPLNATTFQVALTGGTGSAADVNNYTTQNVTFPAGSSANQTVNLTITNDAAAEGNETAIFSIQNVSGGNSASSGAQSTFTLTISDPITNYYSGVNTTLNGSSFKTELHNLIKGHTAFPYTSSSTDVWDILSHAYQDPSNANNVILIYTGRSQAKTYNASTNSSDPNAWNREHVWAQSRGGFDVDNFPHNPGVASDAHNLAPADASVNSDRGNKDFDLGGTPHLEAIGSFMDADSFEPRDAVKGDVARMLLYMDVRYEGGNGEVQLELMDGVNTPVGTIGKLSTLLLWHQQDPPDAFEINRNDVIFSYQGNKNPFIDHPEWVAKIYGANAAPTISNISRSLIVPFENQNVTISANIIDDSSVSSAQVLYTVNGGTEQSVNMSLTFGTSFSGTIPESAYLDGNLLQYKIKAVDNQANERISESYRVFVGNTSISTLHQTDVNGVILYNGVYARISGVATVQNGLFSSTNLEVNLQDATGGIVVYKVIAGSTSFQLGRNYTVTGALTQYNGLAELVPDNVATDIIDGGVGTAVQPTIRTFAQLLSTPEVYEGMLIKVQNVNKTSGTWANSQNLTVNDGTSSAITVRISSGTNLASNPEPAWPKDVVGVFTQFDSTTPFTDSYQLKPRSISDIQNITPAVVPTKYLVTSNNYNPTVGGSVTITAQLADASNNNAAAAGKVVTWSSSNGGSFSSATSTTDAAGKATITYTVSTAALVSHVVTATDNSVPTQLTGNSIAITTQSGNGVAYIVNVSNINPTVSTQINASAQLVDAFNNNVLTAGKIVEWTSTNGGQFSTLTSNTNANGIAQITFTVNRIAGTTHRITATENTVFGSSPLVTTKAGNAFKYLITVNESNPIVGSQIFASAQLVDQNENPLTIQGINVNWTSLNGGSFNQVSSLTNTLGRADIIFTSSNIAGVEHQIVAADNNGLTGNSGLLKTIPDIPNGYKITVSNNQPSAGSTIQVEIQLVDKYGNPVTESGRIIAWSSNNDGSFSSPTSTLDIAGKAAVQFVVNKKAGIEHKIEVVDNSTLLLKGISEIIKTVAGNGAKYLLTVNNLNPLVGTTVSITAQLVDINSNPVFLGNRVITWTSTNGGIFSSANSNTDSNGKAIVDFTISSLAGTRQKITATDANSITGVSEEITTKGISVPKLLLPANNAIYIPLTQIFTWQTITEADSYELIISSDNSFVNNVFTYINIITNSKEISNLEKSKTYFWKVRAKKGFVYSNFSEIWSIKTLPNLPAKPVLSLPSENARNVRINSLLSWKSSIGAEGYDLQLSEDNLFTKLIENKVGLTDVSYRPVNLKHSQSYFWRVKATNISGGSEYSDAWSFSVIDTIYAPSELTAVADINFTINLEWKDNSNNETEFILERLDEGNASYYQFDKVAANTTTYSNSYLEQGKTYTYRIKAVNEFTKSPFSNLLTVVVPKASINPPSNLSTTVTNNGHIVLSWNDNSMDEIGYIIYRAELVNNTVGKINFASVNSGLVPIDTIPANSIKFIDNKTTIGKTYKYQVVTLSIHGVSVPAETPSPIKPLISPTGLKALLSVNSAAISWLDNSNDESGFVVLRANKPQMIYKAIDTTQANVNSFLDNSIFDGRKFYYKVFAISKSNGLSGETNSDSIYFAMKAPNNVKVSQQFNQNKINLTWADNSASESGYIIERKESGQSNFGEIASVNSNVAAFTDASVANKKNYQYRIKGFNEDGFSPYSVESSILVGVETNEERAFEFALHQNFPNPFNPTTEIKFALPKSGNVELSIYNMLGEKIQTLASGMMNAGEHKISFNAGNYTSGVYLYKLITDGNISIKKMILMK